MCHLGWRQFGKKKKKKIGKLGLKQGCMVADRAGSIFLKWNLEVIMEMQEKLTGIQRSASVPYGGMCMYGGGTPPKPW